jgi:hypothetical protein
MFDEYFSHPDQVLSDLLLYGMGDTLEQNTCCSAAHSALAHVIMIADASGSLPAGVDNNVGASLSTEAKFTTGSGGASAIAG